MASRRRQGRAVNPLDGRQEDMTVQEADTLLFGSRDAMIELDKLRLDGGTQPRAKLNEDTIAEYAEDMRNGVTFPAITVFYDGSDYWLADGFHRVKAARQADKDRLRADIRQGTRRDAVLHSVGVNAQHGLRRSNEDKRRSVMTLLEDKEWAEWSNREIARCCKVSEYFVRGLRDELSAIKSQMETDDIPDETRVRLARWLSGSTIELRRIIKTTASTDDLPMMIALEKERSVPRSTVIRLLQREIEHRQAPSDEPQTRTVQRGDQVYEQKVSSQQRRDPVRTQYVDSPDIDQRTGYEEDAIHLDAAEPHGQWDDTPSPDKPAAPRMTWEQMQDGQPSGQQQAYNYALQLRVKLEKGLLDMIDAMGRIQEVRSIYSFAELDEEQIDRTDDLLWRVLVKLGWIVDPDTGERAPGMLDHIEGLRAMLIAIMQGDVEEE